MAHDLSDGISLVRSSPRSQTDAPPRIVDDRALMFEAIAEADAAARDGDVPVGCLIVDEGGTILGRGRNRRERDQDPTAHAEIVALRQAAIARGHWRLDGTTAFVTLEPCPMCAGAFVNARVKRVVYAATDAKAGALHSAFGIGLSDALNHRLVAEAGLLASDSVARLQAFFGRLRALGEK